MSFSKLNLSTHLAFPVTAVRTTLREALASVRAGRREPRRRRSTLLEESARNGLGRFFQTTTTMRCPSPSPLYPAPQEDVAAYVAASLECACATTMEAAIGVFGDPAWAALNLRRPGLQRGNVLTGQHFQVALRKDPRLQPVCAGHDVLLAVLNGFLDHSLAELLGTPVLASAAAAGGEGEGGDGAKDNSRWARKRDDAITDVELNLVLKRLNPSYSLGSDALLLLAALHRETLSLAASALRQARVQAGQDAAGPLAALIPAPIQNRCAEAGLLALSVLRGTVQLSPNVALRFVLLRTGGVPQGPGRPAGKDGSGGAGAGSGGGGGGGGASTSGGGYAVTLSRREQLHEAMSAACKQLHFEDRKAAVFLFRGSAIEGSLSADDLGIIRSGVIYLVQRQWWDFQRREEARRGVLTSTKSNDAAVRGFKEKATSRVAAAVAQTYSPGASGAALLDASMRSDPGTGEDDAGSYAAGGSALASTVQTGDDGSIGGAASSMAGGAALPSRLPRLSGTTRLARVRGLPEPTRQLDFNGAAPGAAAAAAVTASAHLTSSPQRPGRAGLGGAALSPPAGGGRILLDKSPYLSPARPGLGRNGTSPRVFVTTGDEDHPGARGGARSTSPRGRAGAAGGGGGGVEIPFKVAKALLTAATTALARIDEHSPTVASATDLLTAALRAAGDAAEGTTPLDLKSLKGAAAAIQAAGKDLLAAVSAVEGAAAKRSVQEQTRRYAERMTKPTAAAPAPAPAPARGTVSPVRRLGAAAPSSEASGLLQMRQRAQESLRALEKASASAGPAPSPVASPVRGRPAGPTNGSPEAKAAALNRLKSRSPPPQAALPAPSPAPSPPPAPAPAPTWERGEDYQPAPIVQVKISGAVLSSKLKFAPSRRRSSAGGAGGAAAHAPA
jgi:hypothetical protein